MFVCRARATPRASGGTSSVITDPAPVHAALRDDLACRAGAGARTRADRCSLAASGDRANDRAQRRAAAGELSRSLINAYVVMPLLDDIDSADRVGLPVDVDRLQIEHQVGGAVKVSAACRRPDDDARP